MNMFRTCLPLEQARTRQKGLALCMQFYNAFPIIGTSHIKMEKNNN